MSDEHQHSHDHEKTYDELRKALTREFWDERYGGSDRVWSGKPNLRMVEQTRDLSPGNALEVACGEGADAIWLAEQGWLVTATDVSTVALERTASHAIERGVADRLQVAEYDVMAGDPALKEVHYDLVAASFLHVPRPDFDTVYLRIAAAVAPGGRLLVVAHHPHDVESGARSSHGPGLMFGPEQLVSTLEAAETHGPWEVEYAGTPTREQVVDGSPVTLTDTVVRLRRS